MMARDYSNFSTEALLEELKALADDFSQDPRNLIIEAMDRLELVSIEAVDLAYGMSKARQDSDFWQQKATEAMNRIKRLEEAGDAMVRWIENYGCKHEFHQAIEIWTAAKEAKP